jgi:hypothetical protein
LSRVRVIVGPAPGKGRYRRRPDIRVVIGEVG